MRLREMLQSVIPAAKVAELLAEFAVVTLEEVKTRAEMTASEVTKYRDTIDKIWEFQALAELTPEQEAWLKEQKSIDELRPLLEVAMVEASDAADHWNSCKDFKMSTRQIRSARKNYPCGFLRLFRDLDVDATINEKQAKTLETKALEQNMKIEASKGLFKLVKLQRAIFAEIEAVNEITKTARGDELTAAIKLREEKLKQQAALHHQFVKAREEAEALGIKYRDSEEFKAARNKFLTKFRPKRAAKANKAIVQAPTQNQMLEGLVVNVK